MSLENTAGDTPAAQDNAAQTEAEEVEPVNTEIETEGADGEGDSPAVDDDTDEIEHEGQKYRIPKAIKPALMMHADYTRKTQEVAEQRKAIAEEQERFRQSTKLYEAAQQEHARLITVEDQLQQFQRIDWQTFWNQDPVKAGSLMSQFEALKQQKETLKGQIQEKQTALQTEAQRVAAKQAEESRAYIQREIPEWSPDLDNKLTKFALDQGFSADDLKGLARTNPRAVKVLHLAFIGKQLTDKQRIAAKPKPPVAEPVPQVSASRSTATKEPNRMSTEQWMKWRNKQAAGGR